MGNSRIALKLTAIATSIGGAPAPSAEIRITCAGAAHTSRVDNASHQDAKAEIMGERAHADIGADQHQEEHRGPRRFHAAEEGGRIGIEGAGRGHGGGFPVS